MSSGAVRDPAIRNYRPAGARAAMQYRRFGRTEKWISEITLGGMRFTGGWSKPRTEPHREMLEHCMSTLSQALGEGVNHIETAYGYGKSEHCYGLAFQELGVPRDRYFLMTKGDPETAEQTKRMLEEQLAGLRTDHIDFYGWHGINTKARLDVALAKGGAVETLRKYQEQGVIGHIGFSTHAPLDIIVRAVESGAFDFVNLHYYYFFQRNFAAIQLAELRDMGVFIISPNDKGGRLFEAPALLRELTAPLTPIQFNARFCLRSPAVHTLSFGLTNTNHFEEMAGIFPTQVPLSPEDLMILGRMNGRLEIDPLSAYEGYDLAGDPSGINIPELLRFRRMWKCYGMEGFGKYRYNMLEGEGHWVPGHFATPERVAKVDVTRVPDGIPLRQMLSEVHANLYQPKVD